MRSQSLSVLIFIFILLAIFVMGGAYYLGKSLSKNKNSQLQNLTVKPSVLNSTPNPAHSGSADAPFICPKEGSLNCKQNNCNFVYLNWVAKNCPNYKGTTK